jgi:hypothetical protein
MDDVTTADDDDNFWAPLLLLPIVTAIGAVGLLLPLIPPPSECRFGLDGGGGGQMNWMWKNGRERGGGREFGGTFWVRAKGNLAEQTSGINEANVGGK